MIYKFLFLFFFSLSLFGSSLKKEQYYVVELFSIYHSNISNEKLKKDIPSKLLDNLYIYRNKDKIRGCYTHSKSYKTSLKFLKIAKNNGYRDAYISKTSVCYPHSKMKNKNKNISFKKRKKTDIILTPSSVSEIIVKINKAKLDMDELKMISYYEHLILNGYNIEKFKINLCYLYGKKGLWSNAYKIISDSKTSFDLIYAYSIGAIKTNQKNFYFDLKNYINVDKSGKLLLLTACYFEKQHDMKKANFYYEEAYEKNKQNPFVLYYYARMLYNTGKIEKSINIYENILRKMNKAHPLFNVIEDLLQRIKK